MRVFKPILYILIVLIAGFVIFLAFSWLDDYRPEETTLLSEDNSAVPLPDSATLDLVIWNIGYAGLDASMDFFYDGGKQMRPSEAQVVRNIQGIVETLAPYREFDVVMLQEVDQDSKRSYGYNEAEIIEESFGSTQAFFGKNYEVAFVPIPLKEPMGRVHSGLLTLSRHVPSTVVRCSFPGNYAWPKKLFMLDRCFLVCRYPLSGGKHLLVINTHNSAYDDGSLRAGQMEYLRQFLLAEYRLGNYIIVGGDWNQSPYNLPPELPAHRFDTENLTYVEKDYPEAGWTWAYDPRLPTNRRVGKPYNQETSLTTIIDFYLLSPNIRLNEVNTVDVDFQYSDHQPVRMEATLIP